MRALTNKILCVQMNILFHEIEQDYSVGLAEELSSTGLNIASVVTFSHPAARQAFLHKQAFARTDKVDVYALFDSAQLTEKYGHYFTRLDAAIIDFFSEIERDFYILTDRQNYTPLTFTQRKLYFRNLIRFWLGYLQQHQIQGAYFLYCPHATWQLVLLHACRYLGIRYAYLSHTSLNNRCLLRESYASLEKVPEDYLQNANKADIIATIPSDLWEDFSKESLINNFVKANNDLFIQGKATTKSSRLRAILKALVFATPLHYPFLSFQAKRGLSNESFQFATSMDAKNSGWKYHLATKAHQRHAKALKAFYEAHATVEDTSQPYIYFPMHLQPEMTTQPEAAVYEDHLLALEVILSALPEGWRVYVKENPRQFDTSINRYSGQHFRSIADYKAMLAHQSLIFVPLTRSSETLIENAALTVTLTGTAGWEAMLKGRPCATFGHPWYSPCRSCFTINTPLDMAAAITKAASLSPELVEKDILRFISYYQDRLIVASRSSPTAVACNTLPVNILQKHHAAKLYDFYTK